MESTREHELVGVPREIREKLDQLPKRQKTAIMRDVLTDSNHMRPGVGLGSTTHSICAYCRQRSMVECIARFCSAEAERNRSTERSDVVGNVRE